VREQLGDLSANILDDAAMTEPLSFDAALVQRYDRNGPRYTSYPTAAQFHSGFDIGAYRRAALLSNVAATPLSIYVHVPFCTSPCLYCGCNRVITRDRGQAIEYIARLEQEIELQARLFDSRRSVQQLHFGGGTPTFLDAAQLQALLEHLGRSFSLAPTAQRETSIEIDPRTVNAQQLGALAALGFNRISLGVQDFDAAVQRAVNRIQPISMVHGLVERARAIGFRSISFDLIYGLPLQTHESFSRTLDAAIAARPDRLAVYGYAHMPRIFKAQRRIQAAQLPTPEQRLALLGLTIEKLTGAGYEYIGMDHFALPDDELARARRTGTLHRNFQGYSTHADCDLVGLGVSAIGKVGDAYAQNHKRLADYYRAIDAGQLAIERGVSLTIDDITRREVIQRLMCTGQVVYQEIGQLYELDFQTYFAREIVALKPMLEDQLITMSKEALTITPKGALLLRNIAMTFDRYLQASEREQYSKAI
jgi:oxygen-independent coproporphyrinogen III oxidase